MGSSLDEANELTGWTRFWCPPTGSFPLTDEGFLVDPETEGALIGTGDLVAFEQIQHVPCLILLGEPGIGKSTAMKIEAKRFDGAFLFRDLRSYGSEDRLLNEVFRNQSLDAWSESPDLVHLFLDSLDECLLRIDQVASIIADELRTLPVARLHLRIACRTGEWPPGLESELRELWGEEGVGVYELVPLRRRDVEAAAETRGLDSQTFVSEVIEAGAVPLAIKPVTLAMLLNLYARNQSLPRTQGRLYELGAELLCTETRPLAGARRRGTLASSQKLHIAERIAAISVFSNRYAVWTLPDAGNVPEEDVTLSELTESTELLRGEDGALSESSVRETISTGLFSGRGDGRMGWAHQTYRDFLAARCLVREDLVTEKIASLLLHPSDPSRRVVPQLHQVAAWVATMRRDIFDLLLQLDPEVLLLGDVGSTDFESRERLTEALLELLASGRLARLPLQLRRRLSSLAHPGLAEALRRYITDSDEPVSAREAAIDIAEACRLVELEPELTEVALSPSEEPLVRVGAGYAVARIGSVESARRLRPLLADGHDPHDELKGVALLALWPREMSAEEVLDALHPPKSELFFGAYRHFLWRFADELPLEDLGNALSWVGALAPSYELDYAFQDLMARLLSRAFASWRDTAILDQLARTVVTRLRVNDDLKVLSPEDRFSRETQTYDEARRHLVARVLDLIKPEEALHLVFSANPLVVTRDIPWLVQQLDSMEGRQRKTIAKLIVAVFDRTDIDHIKTILELSERDSTVAEEAASFVSVVDLESELAQDMREAHERVQRSKAIDSEGSGKSRTDAKQISMLLAHVEAGQIDEWVPLTRLLLGEEAQISTLSSELSGAPGWLRADSLVRRRLLKAARKYLEESEVVDDWIGVGSVSWLAIAGFRAFQLLQREAQDLLDELADNTWKEWARVLTWYPVTSGTGGEDAAVSLFCAGASHAPNEYSAEVVEKVWTDNDRGVYIFGLERFVGCDNDHVLQTLYALAKDPSLKPSIGFQLWGALLDIGVTGVREFLQQLVGDPLSREADSRDRALQAAMTLLAKAEDGGWPILRDVLSNDAEFGRDLFEGLAGAGVYKLKFHSRLRDSDLGELVGWLYTVFPPQDDPRPEGVHAVGPREQVAHWRDDLLRDLQSRGSDASVSALRELASTMTQLPWFHEVLGQAETELRRKSWTPIPPRDLVQYIYKPVLALVEGGEQLLSLVVNALGRLNRDLKAETSPARLLWEEEAGHPSKPRNEASLSDFLKWYLETNLTQRGIVLNREVEVSRGNGGAPGQRTDIHIDAIRRGPSGDYDRIRMICEVKGSWNSRLFEAIETQLVERYLRENDVSHGIYVVGWFESSALSDTRHRLQDRAMELSNKHGIHVETVILDFSLSKERNGQSA